MIPITIIAVALNYFWPIEQQIKEAKEYEFGWIAKLAARDLLAHLPIPLLW